MTTRHNAWMVVAILLAVSTVQAATIHVDIANCPGPGDGSELDPYCSIQTAIVNAEDTDEIVVAPGTYLETIDFMGKAVWLHSSDGPEVTIIDATGFFHVVQCVNGEGPDTVLDGFTITGGNADGAVFPEEVSGGGMFNDNSSPTVSNCTFSGNSASFLGGGMFNGNSSPTVTNCTFSGNSASFFGGGMSNDNSNPTVTGCTFSGNTADSTGLPGVGGGMDNSSSSPTLNNCMFSALTMNEFLPALLTPSNTRARDSAVSAGSPRELIIVDSGSPMNTHESANTPWYSGKKKWPMSLRIPLPSPATQKKPVSR